MLQMLEKLPKENAREYAARVLRHNIISMNLKPGQFISEHEICEQMETSRTPVREAFIQLGKEKMVEIYPQRGTCISLIDSDMVEQARFLRNIVEQAVVEIACASLTSAQEEKLEENLYLQAFYVKKGDCIQMNHLDSAFHQGLFEAANREAILIMIGSAMTHFDRVRTLSLASAKLDRFYEDHSRIFQAVRSRDPEAAKREMSSHLSRFSIDLQELKTKYPLFFK